LKRPPWAFTVTVCVTSCTGSCSSVSVTISTGTLNLIRSLRRCSRVASGPNRFSVILWRVDPICADMDLKWKAESGG
jgi:hypothetical protein